MARLDSARSMFEARVRDAENFALRSRTARNATVNRPAFLSNHVEWAHEAALLKIVVASEQFFEVTLGLYAIGERTTTGYRPRRRRLIQSSLPSMLEVFRGDQEFIGWNEPSVVMRRAERWLRNGEPYQTTLSAASQLLMYLKVMRNAIAHASDNALEKYENATRKLYGALPKRVSPGAQLMQSPPTGIPYLSGTTLFEASVAVYRLVASRIVR